MMTGKNALNFSTRSSHAAHTRTLISDDGKGDNENGDGVPQELPANWLRNF